MLAADRQPQPPRFQPPREGWTPEQQIAHMLDLCEAQIEAALSESDLAVEALIKAFSGSAETAAPIRTRANCRRTRRAREQARQAVRDDEQMAAAVMAFQFYDKLTQRLGHVRYSLSTLALFVCDRSQASQSEQWRKLFMTLRGAVSHRGRATDFPVDGRRRSARGSAEPGPADDAVAARGGAREIELF